MVEITANSAGSFSHVDHVHEGGGNNAGFTVHKADSAFLNEMIRSKQPPVYRDPATGAEVHKGKLVEGIPFTTPDRHKPSITLRNPQTGQQASSDNADHTFSQQSISKTIAHAQGIGLAGSEPAFRRFVGTEASGEAYNSHKTLPDGRAPNPHVNLGAIWTHLVNHKLSEWDGRDSLVDYKDLMHRTTGNPALGFKNNMANGEYNEGPGHGGISNNRQMAENMTATGGLLDKLPPFGTEPTDAQRKMDGETSFLNYCYACSTQVNTKDLAAMAGTFENKGRRVDPDGGKEQVFDPKTADAVKRTNVVSGSYNESGTEYVKAHAGVKTGVEGGIMGTVETPDGQRVAAGAYHPDLNAAGNSGAGQKYLHGIAGKTSVFPSQEAAYRAAGSDVRSARPGEFGESPYDMNKRLMQNVQPGVADMLHAASLDLQPQNGGAFYLKNASAHDAKHKSTADETPVLSVQNQDGSRTHYAFADASHALSKFRVRTEEPFAPPPNAPSGTAMPGAWPEGESSARQGG